MYDYKAKIINVVDGDTVDAEIDVGFKMKTIQRLRMNRINTREMHDKDEAKRALAIQAKQFTSKTLLGKDVVLITSKSDAFGRWLAEIVLDDINFNNLLLENGLALPFV
jgi:micrococcal nuclease